MRSLNELAWNEVRELEELPYYQGPLQEGLITRGDLYRIAYINCARHRNPHESDISHYNLLADELNMKRESLERLMDVTQRVILTYAADISYRHEIAEHVPDTGRRQSLIYQLLAYLN